MGAHIVDSVYFNHLVYSDTTEANNWYRIYEEMGYMAYDTTILLTQDSVMNLADRYTKKDTFPLAIMDFKYNLLKPGVLDTNIWFDFDTINHTLSDQPSRPSSPYQPIQNIFQCSSLEEEYGYANPVFMVNPSFIFTDPPPPGCNTCHRLPYTLKIDFEDGTGWHTFSSDTTAYYRPMYLTSGDKIITFRLDSAGITKKFSKSLFKIGSTATLAAADSTWSMPGLSVSFFGGCESTMQKKFVIYLEGLDILEDRSAEEVYDQMIKNEGMADLRNLGYTFAVVNWSYSYKDIELNAMSVVGLIDTLKKRYPNLPPLVVVGESMGGIVGRFALRWMETANYLHDQTHPHLMKMHNTRLFITIDAPQHGANIPLAYQWLYRIAQYNPLMKTLMQPRIWHNIIGGYAPRLSAPAVKQMLIYHINNDPLGYFPISYWKYDASRDKAALEKDFIDMGNGGWPEFCKKVALSNGSWRGDRQERAWDNGYRNANDDFLKVRLGTYIRILGTRLAGADIGIHLQSNPDGDGDVFDLGQDFYNYSIKLKRWGVKFGLTKTPGIAFHKGAIDCKSYCVSAGSNLGMNMDLFSGVKQKNIGFNALGIFGLKYQGGSGGLQTTVSVGLPFGILAIDATFEARSDATDFCFIPTGSSFGYTEFDSQSLDYSIIGDSIHTILSQTPYDVVVTNPSHHVEYTTKTERNGNRQHLYVENNYWDYNDYTVCSYPSPHIIQSRILNREIGDDSLYLENTNGIIPFTIEAYKGLFVNIRNPHYNYNDYTLAKYANYEYDEMGRNGNGSIVLSKSEQYKVLSSAHTFKYNDSFRQEDLLPWQYVQVPSAMFPCCIDFTPMMRLANPDDTTQSQTKAGKVDNIFRVFPNPATRNIKIEYSFANEGISHISLYNVIGQRIAIYDNYCTGSGSICSFDLSLPLASGLYLLRIDNGKERHEGKIIISQ